MKKILAIIIISLAAFSAQGQDYRWAIGVRGGGCDAGVTVKHILKDNNAFELGINYWYPKNEMLRGEALVALYEWNTALSKSDNFILFYGCGAHVGSATVKKEAQNVGKIGLGIDAVVGIEYKLKKAPFAFSLDYRPFLNVLPSFTTFLANAGVGVKVAF